MVALLLRSGLSRTTGKIVGSRAAVSLSWMLSTPTPHRFSSTTNVSPYAEDLHIGRALSRPLDKLDPKTRSKWKKKVQDPSIWSRLVVPESRYTKQYEMDALQDIHALSFQCNVLLEIRDVRLPASTHHPSFSRLARHRKHLICYTHADLINGATCDRVEAWTRQAWPKAECRFVDTRESRPDSVDAFDEVYKWIMRSIEQAGGSNYALTVGVPNTGKSSVLTNLLRYAREKGHIKKTIKARPIRFNKKGKKVKENLRKGAFPAVLDVPGKTRELTEYVIYEENGKYRKYFLDVPGMTPPWFFFQERPEAWYGFGAANLLHMSANDTDDEYLQRGFCDYLLYCLNRDERFDYVKKLDLTEPTNDVSVVLGKFSNRIVVTDEKKLLLNRCRSFLKLFQTGNCGPVILDDISYPYQPFQFKDSYFRRKKHDHDHDHYDDRDDEDDFWNKGKYRDET